MSQIAYNDFDKTKSYQRLLAYHPSFNLRQEWPPDRVRRCDIAIGAGLRYNYAAKAVDDGLLTILQAVADEQQLIAKYREIFSGAVMNPGEQRMVLHHLTRGDLGAEVIHQGNNLRAFYLQQQRRIAEFVENVRNRSIVGSTGKPFTTVVQIGIGGSDLGPRALYLALRGWAAQAGCQGLTAEFISNVDPDDALDVLARIDVEQTLFVLVSKSGTTQETLTNQEFIKARMQAAGVAGLNPNAHFIAVTSETSPLAQSSRYLTSFYIDDFIGGRYSSTSAVGGVVLSLAFGPEAFTELLAGAHDADRQALTPSVRDNAALLDALIGVAERLHGAALTAILPYSQALSRFPAHLQQLDMESNGKSVNRFGRRLTYQTGPVVFGEPGTNGQHSFYQLLHQGTQIVPLQFIGFTNSQRGADLQIEGATSQQKLNANLAAQIVAFAKGKDHRNLNKSFEGNRPSSLIYGARLTPRTLGALLAHYENKVMFQGLTWNLNSFDQEGVQLGKVLTQQALAREPTESALEDYVRILGVK